jgi:hypothetical protein
VCGQIACENRTIFFKKKKGQVTLDNETNILLENEVLG